MSLPLLAPPSRNPTVDKRLRTILRFIFEKMVKTSVDDMLPARVVAYDRATNMASVQPLIQLVTTLNTLQTREQIARVPVIQIGGGGYVLNFPIKPGDLGWIKANDRDISLFTQFWNLVRPNTGRNHSFEDGVFLPSILTDFTIADGDADNVVLQTLDGTVSVSLSLTTVTVRAPTQILLDSPATKVTGTLEVDGNATLKADAIIQGSGQIDGTLNVTGEITGDSIDLSTHTHSGVQTGPNDTGPPV